MTPWMGSSLSGPIGRRAQQCVVVGCDISTGHVLRPCTGGSRVRVRLPHVVNISFISQKSQFIKIIVIKMSLGRISKVLAQHRTNNLQYLLITELAFIVMCGWPPISQNIYNYMVQHQIQYQYAVTCSIEFR